MIHRSICQNAGGTFAEWFDDEREMFAVWYGPVATLPQSPPAECEWWPAGRDESPDPFDLACERRWD